MQASLVEDEATLQAQARVGLILKDKWRLERLLGVGGMAAVYEATHRNRSRVAVKMLHGALSLERDVKARFLREGYVANSVDHEGAVSVLDDDIDDEGNAFLVLELLEGETLDSRWARNGNRLEASDVLALMAQVVDVLIAAHAKGIVHRDLKPENIFITHKGVVKILDFGIARLREESEQTMALTQSGSTMGTPVFMAPEQARGRWELVDGQTDIWAIGATMFTLLSGRWVHEQETWNETLIAAATQPARSLGSVAPYLDASVIAFVDKALAYEKTDRWADAWAMREALQKVAEGLSTRVVAIDPQAATLPSDLAFAGGGGAVGGMALMPTQNPSLVTRTSPEAVSSVPPEFRPKRRTVVPLLATVVLIGGLSAYGIFVMGIGAHWLGLPQIGPSASAPPSAPGSLNEGPSSSAAFVRSLPSASGAVSGPSSAIAVSSSPSRATPSKADSSPPTPSASASGFSDSDKTIDDKGAAGDKTTPPTRATPSASVAMPIQPPPPKGGVTPMPGTGATQHSTTKHHTHQSSHHPRYGHQY